VDVLRGFEPAPPELFAQALHTVVQVLTLAGRAQEAKQPAQEVVQVYRKLATAPGANRAEIAQNLLALTSTLSSAGLNDEAVDAAQAAVDLLRETASHTPDIDAIGLLPRDTVVRSQ
jgi:hypothetical protein